MLFYTHLQNANAYYYNPNFHHLPSDAAASVERSHCHIKSDVYSTTTTLRLPNNIADYACDTSTHETSLFGCCCRLLVVLSVMLTEGK